MRNLRRLAKSMNHGHDLLALFGGQKSSSFGLPRSCRAFSTKQTKQIKVWFLVSSSFIIKTYIYFLS